MTITDSAIVLSREPWRESDKRVVFYTVQHGKIDAVAIGAHKIKSKLSGHLEPLRAVDIMFAYGKQTNKLAQCVTRHNFVSHPVGFERIHMMGACVRLVENATVKGHRDPVLYELLFTTLAQLQAAENCARVFGEQLAALAAHFGYAPQMAQCVVCSRIDELNRFSPQLGGVVCRHEQLQDRGMPYSPAPEHLAAYVKKHLQWRSLI